MALFRIQELFPFAKDLVHHPGMDDALLTAIDSLGIRANTIRAAPSGSGGLCIVTLQGVGVAHEVQCVGDMYLVRQRIRPNIGEIGVAPDLGELQVHNLRTLVDVYGLFVLAHAQVDVTGHVHHVTGDGDDVFQFLRRRHS